MMGMFTKDPRPVLVFEGPGRAKQSMKDECDVNRIVTRFRRDGIITHLAQGAPRYADVSEIADYRTAIETVRTAEEFFRTLPAKVRARFKNDPAEFVDFVADPANAGELEKMGHDLYGERRKAALNRRASDGPTEAPPEPLEGSEGA